MTFKKKMTPRERRRFWERQSPPRFRLPVSKDKPPSKPSVKPAPAGQVRASLEAHWLDYCPPDHPTFVALLAAHEGRWTHFVLMVFLAPQHVTDIQTYAEMAAGQGNREAFWYIQQLDPVAFGPPERYLEIARKAADQTLAIELAAEAESVMHRLAA